MEGLAPTAGGGHARDVGEDVDPATRIVVLLLMMLGAPFYAWMRFPHDRGTALVMGVTFELVIGAFLVEALLERRRLRKSWRAHEPTRPVVPPEAVQGSRRIPLVLLLAGIMWIALSYNAVVEAGRGNPVVIVCTPVLLLLGLGGLIHPPVFHAMRRDIRVEPRGSRAIGFALLIIGLALGVFAAWRLYGRAW